MRRVETYVFERRVPYTRIVCDSCYQPVPMERLGGEVESREVDAYVIIERFNVEQDGDGWIHEHGRDICPNCFKDAFAIGREPGEAATHE